jgi:hypothetical protein
MQSWYLPVPAFPLWPCLALVIVMIPVSLWHERNLRRTLDAYSAVRVEAGVAEGEWPPSELRFVLGVQPWLLVVVAVPLAVMAILGIVAGVAWPAKPFGFEREMNFFDLPFLWSVVVMAVAAITAVAAMAVDLLRSPWREVARCVRRAIHASPAQRAELFARALEADPDVIAARTLQPAEQTPVDDGVE